MSSKPNKNQNYRNKSKGKGGYSANGKTEDQVTSGSQDVTRNSKRNNDCVSDKAVNDPAWYAKNAQLLRDTANIPFGRALGSQITFGVTDAEDGDNSFTPYEGLDGYAADTIVPGIMRIDLIPSFGVSNDNTSALNLAVRNIYSYVRHANSGHSNYDAPDLGLYLLSMDSLYTLWGWMVRLYGCAMTYNGMNRYYPKKVLEAMGVDPEDIIENLPALRTAINVLAAKMSSLYVPAVMNIFTRHQWLYRNLYLDAPGSKAQTYFFNPAGYYIYDEFSGPGRLVYHKFEGFTTVKEIKRQLNFMLDKLLESEDIGIMSGDILKAYGASNCYTFGAIPETYSVLPVYSEEVNMQIHNMTNLGLTLNYNTDSFHITQDTGTGALRWAPVFSTPAVGFDRDSIIDMYTTDVSPEHTMVATRLMCTAEYDTYWEDDLEHVDGALVHRKVIKYKIASCGSEVVANVQIFRGDSSYAGFSSEMLVDESQSTYYSNGWQILTAGGAFGLIADMAAFDWAPLIRAWIYENNPSHKSVLCAGYLNDLDNYAVVSNGDLSAMHDVALLSLLDVPASV